MGAENRAQRRGKREGVHKRARPEPPWGKIIRDHDVIPDIIRATAPTLLKKEPAGVRR